MAELQTWFGGFAINLGPDHIYIIEGTPAEEIKKNLLKNEERISTFISIAARIVYFYRKNDKLCSVLYTFLGVLPPELAKRKDVPREFGFYGESDINNPDDCLSFMKTMLSLMDENKIKKLRKEFEPLLKTDKMPQDKSRYFIDKIPFNPQGDEIAIEIPGIEKKSLYKGGRTIDYYPIAISEDTTFHLGLEVKKGKTVIVMERLSFSVPEIIKGEKVIYDVDKDWKLPQGVKRCKEWREYWKMCEKFDAEKFLKLLDLRKSEGEEFIKTLIDAEFTYFQLLDVINDKIIEDKLNKISAQKISIPYKHFIALKNYLKSVKKEEKVRNFLSSLYNNLKANAGSLSLDDEIEFGNDDRAHLKDKGKDMWEEWVRHENFWLYTARYSLLKWMNEGIKKDFLSSHLSEAADAYIKAKISFNQFKEIMDEAHSLIPEEKLREYWDKCKKANPKKFSWDLEFNKLGEEKSKLERLSEIEKQALADADIAPAIALQYAGFNGSDIIALVKANVAPEIAEKYRESRFNVKDIIALANTNIPLDVALRYDKRFDGESIANFVVFGIGPELAASYPKRFNAKDIIALVLEKVTPEIAASYPERFDRYEIVTLFKKNIGPELAASYPEKFSAKDIRALVRQGVKPYEVRDYDERFKGYEIVELIKHAIPPEIANSKRYRQMSAAKIIEDVEERRKHPVLYHIKKLFKRD
ncbi:MAG: hypothetical protein QW199_01695 [Candidatus Pacearchaeota archaeon]